MMSSMILGDRIFSFLFSQQIIAPEQKVSTVFSPGGILKNGGGENMRFPDFTHEKTCGGPSCTPQYHACKRLATQSQRVTCSVQWKKSDFFKNHFFSPGGLRFDRVCWWNHHDDIIYHHDYFFSPSAPIGAHKKKKKKLDYRRNLP